MATRSKRILIVDDEEDLTWTLSKKLALVVQLPDTAAQGAAA